MNKTYEEETKPKNFEQTPVAPKKSDFVNNFKKFQDPFKLLASTQQVVKFDFSRKWACQRSSIISDSTNFVKLNASPKKVYIPIW